jgi:hypothetical protein
MSKQRTLDFGGERLWAVWHHLSERSRKEAITVWARLIAAAAQGDQQGKGHTRESPSSTGS